MNRKTEVESNVSVHEYEDVSRALKDYIVVSIAEPGKESWIACVFAGVTWCV